MQETYARFLEAYGQTCMTPGEAKSRLFKIVHNLMIDCARRRKRYPSQSLGGSAHNVHAVSYDIEMFIDAEDALKRMTLTQRKLIRMVAQGFEPARLRKF